MALPASQTVAPPTLEASTLERDTARRASRRARYDALAVVRRETSLRGPIRDEDGQTFPSRVQLCRRAVADQAAGVSVKVTGTGHAARAGFSGVQTCGSVWACPVCSERINAGRQAELEQGIANWLEAGHAVMFLTLTMRHHAGHRLADLLETISPAWNRLTSGAGSAWNGLHGKPRFYRGGKADHAMAVLEDGDETFIGQYSRWSAGDAALYGIRGFCRLVEVKHGRNGWHPHIHALLFLERPLTDEQTADLRGRLFGRWQKELDRLGFSVLEGVGLDLRPVTRDGIAAYFAKNTYALEPGRAAYEVTGSTTKQLGKGGETPFQFLARMFDPATLEVTDRGLLRLWHEWEQASKGRRQLTWSRGMRDLLELEKEREDTELAEDDTLEGAELVTFTLDEWRDYRLWEVAAAILDGAEGGYLHELLPFLERDRIRVVRLEGNRQSPAADRSASGRPRRIHGSGHGYLRKLSDQLRDDHARLESSRRRS